MLQKVPAAAQTYCQLRVVPATSPNPNYLSCQPPLLPVHDAVFLKVITKKGVALSIPHPLHTHNIHVQNNDKQKQSQKRN